MGMRMLTVMVCLASLLQAADTSTKQAAKQAKAAYQRAEKLAKAGDWASAFAAYQEATDKAPKSYVYIVHRELARQAYVAQLMQNGRFGDAYAVDPANDNAKLQADRAAAAVRTTSC